MSNQIELLRNALKKLSFAAQISGGVAGRDEALQEGIALAEQTLAATATPQAIPDVRVWNQAGGRDDYLFTEGWNKCRDAMLAAPSTAKHEHHGAVAICALCTQVNLKRLTDCPIKLPHVVEHLRKSADYIDSISRSLSYVPSTATSGEEG